MRAAVLIRERWRGSPILLIRRIQRRPRMSAPEKGKGT
jgi:hypothetical protein